MSIVLEQSHYDIFTAPALTAELGRLEEGDPRLDLRNVQFVDACSLGQIVHTLNQLRAKNARATITLENVTDNIRRVIALTKLDDVLRIAESEPR